MAFSSANRSRLLNSTAPHSRLQWATHPHARELWQCSRNSKDEHTDPLLRATHKRHRQPEFTHSKTEGYRGEACSNHNPLSWRWGIWRVRSTCSSLPTGQANSNRHADLEKRLESLRRLIEADPYSALFGRRPEAFHKFGKIDIPWNGFLQSFSKFQRPTKTRKTNAAQCQTNTNHTGLQYDPISGRMVPVSPTKSRNVDEEVNLAHQKQNVHSPNKEEGSTIPGLGENWQQPRTLSTNVDTHLGSKPVVRLPPQSAEGAQTETETSNEAVKPPIANQNSSSKYELDSSISEPTKTTQRQTKMPGPEDSTKKPSSFVDLSSGTSVECPPGNELETKFVTDPASCSDKAGPSEPSSQQPDDQISVNKECLPSDGLEARSTIELAHTSIEEPDCPDTSSEIRPSSQRSVDCSPGSELEAQILSQPRKREKSQSKIQPPIDCSPGTELETHFTANPASKDEATLEKPQIPVAAPTSNVTMDCSPGSELEAMFAADSSSTNNAKTETDLGCFTSSTTKVQECLPSLDISKERVDEFITQNQTPVLESEAQSSLFQQPLPEFYILAFDASKSQITTAKADSFFGIKADTSPHEILPLLNNPAKFVPYFESMQKHGYEIAAGGGDILVFRKTHIAPPVPEKAEQNSSIHADVANSIGDDPKGSSSAPSDPRVCGQPTSEPHPAAESPNIEPKPLTRPGSSSGTAIRRMFFAGAATALTCYAIGAMTEFFRTGGVDGRGADGFTVFESDRRRE
ncbi:hypothetical protein N7452_005430 [Penicillium brevicompactum]|uniref:Uncharacterized protein n=1 Tax=Penicillium brevicompactum TaxID=5074 RepID=A0A9W9QIK9_PENBR|nr:hypothetical protein N7452_005430 [Penicillium brevicompactum]